MLYAERAVQITGALDFGSFGFLNGFSVPDVIPLVTGLMSLAPFSQVPLAQRDNQPRLNEIRSFPPLAL